MTRHLLHRSDPRPDIPAVTIYHSTADECPACDGDATRCPGHDASVLDRVPAVREAVFEHRTREYPLHTTGDLGQLPAYLRDPSRSAVWVHVSSAQERAWAQAHVAAAGGWRLINPPAVPEFFVVAVRESVAPPVVERLVQLVRPHQSADDVRFLGRLFGYSPDDIEWYCRVTRAD